MPEEFVEIATMDSPYGQIKPASEVKFQSLTVMPEHLDVKVGSLEVNFNSSGYGSVKLDGEEIRGTSLEIICRAGHVPVVRLEILAPGHAPTAQKT